MVFADTSYQITKNCRTGVEMIEKHYTVHIKTTIDAAAIIVRRPKRRRQKSENTEDGL